MSIFCNIYPVNPKYYFGGGGWHRNKKPIINWIIDRGVGTYVFIIVIKLQLICWETTWLMGLLFIYHMILQWLNLWFKEVLNTEEKFFWGENRVRSPQGVDVVFYWARAVSNPLCKHQVYTRRGKSRGWGMIHEYIPICVDDTKKWAAR